MLRNLRNMLRKAANDQIQIMRQWTDFIRR